MKRTVFDQLINWALPLLILALLWFMARYYLELHAHVLPAYNQ